MTDTSPSATEPPIVIGVLTAFNRRTSTLDALARLEVSCRYAGIVPRAVLVDDGSTDDTAAAVRAAYPWTEVIDGDGSLFWNRGMHMAQARAMAYPHDYLLWLNDDTRLHPEAIGRLLETAEIVDKRHDKPCIVVGATADPLTGQTSYGGDIAHSRWRPFNYRRLGRTTEPVECHAMNGNIVLIPAAVVQSIGNLDPVFEHAMGDTDYALRARRAGFQVYVAPGHLGECTNNPTDGTYRDKRLPLTERWRKMLSRKGLPPRSWRHFTRRHGGLLWPLHFAWPYIRLLADHARQRRA
jgi:GT2 family glycosyltransferase